MNIQEAWNEISDDSTERTVSAINRLLLDYKSHVATGIRLICIDIMAHEIYPYLNRNATSSGLALLKILYEIFLGKSLPATKIVFLIDQLADNQENQQDISHINLSVFENNDTKLWIHTLHHIDSWSLQVRRHRNYRGSIGDSTIRKSYDIWRQQFTSMIPKNKDELLELKTRHKKRMWAASWRDFNNLEDISYLICHSKNYMDRLDFEKSWQSQKEIEEIFAYYFDNNSCSKLLLPGFASDHFGVLQMTVKPLMIVIFTPSGKTPMVILIELTSKKIVHWLQDSPVHLAIARIVADLDHFLELMDCYLIIFISTINYEILNFIQLWSETGGKRAENRILKNVLVDEYKPSMGVQLGARNIVDEECPIAKFVRTPHGVRSRQLEDEIKSFFTHHFSNNEDDELEIKSIVEAWNRSLD